MFGIGFWRGIGSCKGRVVFGLRLRITLFIKTCSGFWVF